MRLTQIRDFVAVVEAGSIRAAAHKVGISQPAMTKSVKGLEEELHAQLLQRTAKGVTPTRVGRAFFARARAAHAELQKAANEASQREDEGRVAFGVGPLAAVVIVPDAVAMFHARFPNVRVQIVEGLTHTLSPQVRNEMLDFALGPRGPRIDTALAFRPLYRPTHVIAARNGHPLLRARTLAELTNAEWLNLGTVERQGFGPFEEMFTAIGLPLPREIVQCDSYSALIGMAKKTDMLAMLPRSLLGSPDVRDSLTELRIPGASFELNVGLFTRAGVPLTRAASAMVRIVTTVARQLVQKR